MVSKQEIGELYDEEQLFLTLRTHIGVLKCEEDVCKHQSILARLWLAITHGIAIIGSRGKTLCDLSPRRDSASAPRKPLTKIDILGADRPCHGFSFPFEWRPGSSPECLVPNARNEIKGFGVAIKSLPP
ncbi:hypothetical protein KM043_014760 [Ampulex compressa]|nr:hypothetical protein KM043_014760 [Ampulex compressa]